MNYTINKLLKVKFSNDPDDEDEDDIDEADGF